MRSAPDVALRKVLGDDVMDQLEALIKARARAEWNRERRRMKRRLEELHEGDDDDEWP